MLKVVPVWGGGLPVSRRAGSIWGGAGLRFRRMSFVFFAGGPSRVVSVFCLVRAVEVGSSGSAERLREGEAGAVCAGTGCWVATSAMFVEVSDQGGEK